MNVRWEGWHRIRALAALVAFRLAELELVRPQDVGTGMERCAGGVPLAAAFAACEARGSSRRRPAYRGIVTLPVCARRTAVLEGATAHTTLPAIDMARATKFYAEKVGAVPGESREGGSFFALGNSTFSIYPTPNPNRGGHTQMGLRVPDARAAVAELRSRGVVFEEYDLPGLKTVDGIADIGGGSAAWFKDTEGNTIGVVQLNS